MVQKVIQEKNTQIVVRLMNSALKGCEFELKNHKTLFVVKNEEFLNQEVFPSLPDSTIFVPMHQDGINFEISISEEISVIELDEYAERSYHIPLNEVIKIGGLLIAVKKEDAVWSDEVLSYFAETITLSPKRNTKKIALLFGITTLVLVLAFCWLQIKNEPDSIKNNTVIKNILGGNKEDYKVLSGKNEKIYAFSSTEGDLRWAKQSIVRSNTTLPVRVLTYRREEKRISHWLKEYWPDIRIHRIKMEDPAYPILILSQERNSLTPDDQKLLVKSVGKVIPYAKSVKIMSVSDKTVEKEAEANVKRLAIPYQTKYENNSVTFIFSGSIDDTELQQIQSLAKNFYSVWQNEYILFSVKMKDDWLKDKALKYGTNEYIKIAPKHWYFPGITDI
jgi:type III secretion system PrgH/EprH family protein